MEFVYNIKSDGFSGWVKLKLYKYSERLGLVRECNFSLGRADGELSAKSTENLAALEALVSKAGERIIDLEVTCGDKVIKKWDDLEYDSTFDPVIQEVAFTLLNGVKLGEA